MDKIKKAKEWIVTHPLEVTTVLATASVTAQVAYCVYSIVLDRSRAANVRRYRKTFENAVASGVDIRILPSGTTEIIHPKK